MSDRDALLAERRKIMADQRSIAAALNLKTHGNLALVHRSVDNTARIREIDALLADAGES